MQPLAYLAFVLVGVALARAMPKCQQAAAAAATAAAALAPELTNSLASSQFDAWMGNAKAPAYPALSRKSIPNEVPVH